MYITFTYRCSDCETDADRMVKRTEIENQSCDRCDKPLVRLPAGPRTHFRFADTKLKD